jgi:hypothetical protein
MRIKSNPNWIPVGEGYASRVTNLANHHGVSVEKASHIYFVQGGIRRIFGSEHAERFGMASIKGGSLMFFHEGVSPMLGRGTKDIDLQISGFDGTMEDLAAILRDVFSADPEIEDGMRVHVDHLSIDVIKDDSEPVPGGQINVPVQLGRAMFNLKIDIGLYALEQREGLELREIPSITPKHLPPIKAWCQRKEYALGDKFQAACRQGIGNSRMRDYYDMYVMLTRFDLDPDIAAAAFARVFPLYTCKQFGFEVPEDVGDVPALSDTYAFANEGAWAKLKAKHKFQVETPDLATVVATIRDHIQPILDTVHAPQKGYAA